MKIFVCEFITAGGLNRVDLPQSLVQEGSLMRDALLRDLGMLPNTQVITTHDARLSAALLSSMPITYDDDAMLVWQNLLKGCDAAFIVAPETGGHLASLVALVNNAHVLHLGCNLSVIQVASSKYQTYRHLNKAEINVVPTYLFSELTTAKELEAKNKAQPSLLNQWVVKPDDGAGCDDTICVSNLMEVHKYLTNKAQIQPIDTQVIQPFIEGAPASISMLCKAGQAWVVGCNLQKIALDNNKFVYHGSVVNGFNTHFVHFDMIAKKIAQAMPDLAGYVGVDVLVNGDEITVLEINPRLTTSFSGLHESTGLNVTKLILDLFLAPVFTMPEFNPINNKPIEITL